MFGNSSNYSDITNSFWVKDEALSKGFNVNTYTESIDAGGNKSVLDMLL